MPNWCSNDIVITGPEDKIKVLWNLAGEAEGLLQALAPAPYNMFRGDLTEETRQRLNEKNIPNWRDWQVENWGTKWDVDLAGLEHTPGEIAGWFDSAWSPPIEALDTFLKENPDCKVQLKYFEPGMMFVGEYVDGVENTLNFTDPAEVPDEWYDHWNLGDVYEED